MKSSMKRLVGREFGLILAFATASPGCVASAPTTEPSSGSEGVSDSLSGAANAALLSTTPAGCLGTSPTSGAFFNCYYDAVELKYTDGWKCTPPGDMAYGRCKTTTVGKKVSLAFYTQSYAGYPPGIFFEWMPSSAQGSAQVVVDGVDRGLVWLGEDSDGFKSYPLSTGFHTIELIKPARNGDRAIVVFRFGNSG